MPQDILERNNNAIRRVWERLRPSGIIGTLIEEGPQLLLVVRDMTFRLEVNHVEPPGFWLEFSWEGSAGFRRCQNFHHLLAVVRKMLLVPGWRLIISHAAP